MSQVRNYRSHYGRQTRRERANLSEQGFICRHCSMYVSCAPDIAGVQNRNHCPYCLWSRHLDGRVAGDRVSGCRAAMQPVGLTTKRSRNKYASERDGELMIVHRCGMCAKLVINRIAADDSDAALVELFEDSCVAGAALKAELDALGVLPLTTGDRDLLRRRLFGASTAIATAQPPIE